MARHTLPPATPQGPDFVGATPPEMAEQEVRVLEIETQQEADQRALAASVGYQLPGDSLEPDVIQADIIMNDRRSVETCLESGRGLIMLKAVCGHGDFMSRLGAMGKDQSIANRFMQAAYKFSNSATSRNLLSAIGNQSKLFELLILDDEEIEALEETGETGLLKLDDIDCMGVRELRKAVRERNAEEAAKNEVAAHKSKTIDDLQTEVEKLKRHAETITPNEQDGELRAEAQLEAFAIEAAIRGKLCPMLAAALENGESGSVDAAPWVTGVFDVLDNIVKQAREQFGIWGGVMVYEQAGSLATDAFDADHSDDKPSDSEQ